MAAPAELETVQPVAPRAREPAAPGPAQGFLPAAVSPEDGFTPARVIALQRTAGNQAVTDLLDGANLGAAAPWIDALSGAAGGMFGTAGLIAGGPLGAVLGGFGSA